MPSTDAIPADDTAPRVAAAGRRLSAHAAATATTSVLVVATLVAHAGWPPYTPGTETTMPTWLEGAALTWLVATSTLPVHAVALGLCPPGSPEERRQLTPHLATAAFAATLAGLTAWMSLSWVAAVNTLPPGFAPIGF